MYKQEAENKQQSSNLIRLVLSDLDGTLLNDEKQVTANTISAIKRMRQDGYLFGIATGRPYEVVKERIVEWRIDKLCDVGIFDNGAVIFNKEKVIKKRDVFLSNEDIQFLIALFSGRDIGIGIHEDGLCAQQIHPLMKRLLISHHGYFRRIDFKKHVFTHATKFLVFTEDYMDEMKMIGKKYAERFLFMQTDDYIFEVVHKKNNKLEGLKELLKDMNLNLENVLMFGDGENDRSLLLASGISVCMKNGVEEVKQIADEITKSNNEEGVAWFIENKIL